MKYLHFMRDNYFPNIAVSEGVKYLFYDLGFENKEFNKDSLLILRQKDKSFISQ